MSIKHIKNSHKLVSLFINKTLILIPGSHIFGILWQPHLRDSGIPIAWFGGLTAISALVIYLNSKNIDKIESKFGGRKIIFYTGLFPLLAFLAGVYFKNFIVALIFYFVIKIAIWLRDPIFSQYMNDHIKSHNRATVLSSLSMVDSLFDIVIFISAGFIINMGMGYSFLFSAGLMAIALIFFKVTKEHIKIKA